MDALSQMESASTGDKEKRQEIALLFQETKIRHAFMRKVFMIVLVQLIITGLVVAPMLLHQPTRDTIKGDRGIYWASYVLFFAVYIAIVCCNGISRSWPTNYIILFVMTVSLAVWVGCICVWFDPLMVMIAIAICIVLCLTLFLIATQTSIDFTATLGILAVFCIALFILSILSLFMPSKSLLWIMLIGGIVLVSIYFIIDIQMMMGGNHKYSLSPEDYILAATLLYVDIIYIFLYILMILGGSSND